MNSITYTRTAAGNYIVRAQIASTGASIGSGSFVGRVKRTAAGWIGFDRNGVEIGPAHRTRESIAKVLAVRAKKQLDA